MDGFDNWDAAEALDSLKMERSVNPSETEEEMARRILREASAAAAQSIVHIALNDPNSRVRLSAAQTVLDRTLGKIGDEVPKEAEWVEMLQEAMAVATPHTSHSDDSGHGDDSGHDGTGL
jgi:hypothetical protein